MSFMASLSKLASSVGGMMGTVPTAFAIGKDLLELIDHAKDVVASTDLPALEAMREELEPKVLAHADATEQKLRG